MTLYRRMQTHGVALADVLDRPTGAALDGLAVVSAEVSLVRAKQRERDKRDADIRRKSLVPR